MTLVFLGIKLTLTVKTILVYLFILTSDISKYSDINSKANEKRNRSLPAQLVVCLLIAMSFWSKHSMRDVLKNLIDGMSEKWLKVGKYWRAPCKSAITQARQCLGARVMSNLFYRLVRPIATTETLGRF